MSYSKSEMKRLAVQRGSETPAVGRITFSTVANPAAWDIGDLSCLTFGSPTEAKRAEELFSAMQRELAAAKVNRDYWMKSCKEAQEHRDGANAQLAEFERELAQARDELGRYMMANNTLAERAEKAEAKNKALREDAERYRFLRSSNTDVSVLAELIRNARSENRFDAAIDAARNG